MESIVVNEEREFTVYMHVNKTNNKVYVGITQQDVQYRWLSGHGYSHNTHLANAIKKYGWDNFEHIIFAEKLSKKEACHIEQLLIKFYNTIDSEFGYNISTGGEFGGAGVKRSAEARKKMSEAAKRRLPPSHETREKIKKANTGKRRSDEAKKKMSEMKKGKRGSPWTENMYQLMSNPVLQYDKSGIYIAQYKSVRSAAKENEISASGISNCCLGLCPSMGGFLWRYKENDTFPFQIDPFVNKCFVPVRQYSLDGDFIAEYETSREAERQTGINYKDINGVINKDKNKSAGGYMWKRASDYIGVEKIEPYIPFVKPGSPVVQLTLDNQYIAEFSSIKEAQKALNMPNIHIGDCCRGSRLNAGGFHWMYKDEYEKVANKWSK